MRKFLKLVLNRMVLKAGVRLLFHSCLADAERDQEQIRSVTVLNKSGRQTYLRPLLYRRHRRCRLSGRSVASPSVWAGMKIASVSP